MFKINQFSELQSKFTSIMNTNVALFGSSLESCKQITFLQCETVNNLLHEVAVVAKKMHAGTTPLDVTTPARDFMINSGKIISVQSQEFVKILYKAKSDLIELTSKNVKVTQDEIISAVNKAETINPILSGVASQPLQSILNISNQTSEMVSDLAHKVDDLANQNAKATAEVALQSLTPAS